MNMDRCKDRVIVGWTNACMDMWMDGLTDGWADEMQG